MPSEDNTTTRDSVERFRGPDYLTEFVPDRDAMDRLRQLDSHTAQRLVKYVRGGWPGIMSGEDFLGPLAHAEGDVVLRVVDPPGCQWIFWSGNPCGKHFYGRLGALPHYHDHKVTGRRKASPDRLVEYLRNSGRVIPVHVDNVPEPIWKFMESQPAYREKTR